MSLTMARWEEQPLSTFVCTNACHSLQVQVAELTRHHGLLLHLGAKDPSTGKCLPAKHEVITPTWPEVKGLMQARNRLARYGKQTVIEVRCPEL